MVFFHSYVKFPDGIFHQILNQVVNPGAVLALLISPCDALQELDGRTGREANPGDETDFSMGIVMEISVMEKFHGIQMNTDEYSQSSHLDMGLSHVI